MTVETNHARPPAPGAAAGRPVSTLDPGERAALARLVVERYSVFAARRVQLDMTRGKPAADQLDLARGLLETVDSGNGRAADGTDCRNYGVFDGLPEAKALFASYLGVAPAQILIGGNSSLELMHDLVVQGLLVGYGAGPWRSDGAPVRFVCPVPGYDRHFFILERYGVEMVPVRMGADGPDPTEVERLVGGDPSFRGMFCVPRYSNPTGITFSAEVVRGLARMRAQARDFTIVWDDAYAGHHLGGGAAPLPNMLEECRLAGHPERAVVFGSTSKISLAGAGVAMVAANESLLERVRQAMSIRTIGADKLNQLRHVRFFGDRRGIERHMERHAALLRPKFDCVFDVLERRLGALAVAAWTRPSGGYFISLDTTPGCARRTVELAARAGVKLTPAGNTFPYGRDPEDRNLRLAPSLPPLAELRDASELLCDCIVLATLERLGTPLGLPA